jgi:predicted aspartyl protease
MSLPFDSREELIVVPTRVWGPNGELILRFVLDTGSTVSLLNWDSAVKLGYDPTIQSSRVQTTTVSQVEYSPRIMIERVEALGQEHLNFPMLCHTLPPSAGIDGILGLDFFRGHKLTIDFRIGLVTLE